MQVSIVYNNISHKISLNTIFLFNYIRIDSSGAIELAKNLELSVLQSLNLSYNKIESVGVQSLLDALQINNHLQVIHFHCFVT